MTKPPEGMKEFERAMRGLSQVPKKELDREIAKATKKKALKRKKKS